MPWIRATQQRRPIVQEGRPTLRRGPRAGDRLPDARIARDGQQCWLGEALAAPSFHLLLCGPTDNWDTSQHTALRRRYADSLAVHQFTREATPGTLHDPDGQAFRRLGVTDTAHYLVRPDGHIGYRSGGTDLDDSGTTSPAGSLTPSRQGNQPTNQPTNFSEPLQAASMVS